MIILLKAIAVLTAALLLALMLVGGFEILVRMLETRGGALPAAALVVVLVICISFALAAVSRVRGAP